jgi:hypothetical protein
MIATTLATERNRKNLRAVVISCMVLMIGGLLFFCRNQVVYYVLAQSMRSESPELALVPQPLTNYAVNSVAGMNFSYFGYTFQTPWSGVERIDESDAVVRIVFKEGPVVVFFNPKHEGFQTLKDSARKASKPGEDADTALVSFFGPETMTSSYNFTSACMSMTPDKVQFFTAKLKAARSFRLLLIKQSKLKRAFMLRGGTGSSLYYLNAGNVRGFQAVVRSPNGGTFSTLFLSDNSDHELSLIVTTSKEAKTRVTQEDVNRVIQSISPLVEQK